MNDAGTVLGIVPYPLFPATSAGRKLIAQTYTRLAQFRPVVLAGTPAPFPDSFSLPVHPVFSPGKGRYFSPRSFQSVLQLVRKTKPTLVLFEHPYMAWMGPLLKRMTGIRWAIRSHNIEYERFRDFGKSWWPLLRSYELRMYRAADAVFFITEDDLHTARKATSMKHAWVLPAGISQEQVPQDHERCRQRIRGRHGILPDEYVILYNGALDYQPNQEALGILLREILPRLEADPSFKFRILICGAGLDASWNMLASFSSRGVTYCGYVDDISEYFKGADVFVNPVTGGGGIKVRMIEAIAYSVNIVCTEHAARGVHMPEPLSGLRIVEDHNWDDFAQKLFTACRDSRPQTPEWFYGYYGWSSVIERFDQHIRMIS
jgi:polysaccharide biosynthesis protein PslH